MFSFLTSSSVSQKGTEVASVSMTPKNLSVTVLKADERKDILQFDQVCIPRYKDDSTVKINLCHY